MACKPCRALLQAVGKVEVPAFIDPLIARMTPEEKAGQLQIMPSAWGGGAALSLNPPGNGADFDQQVKDARLGEKVCLAVVFRPGQSAAPGELLAHLDHAGLSKFDMPEYFLRLDEIPVTPNGKMLKRAIVDWIKEGRVTPEPVRFEAKRASA